MHRAFLLLASTFILLAACAHPTPDTPTPEPPAIITGVLPTVTPTNPPVNDASQLDTPISPSATPLPLPASAPASSRTLYSLAVDFDFLAHYLEVEGRVSFTNLTTEPLHELLFMVEPNRWQGCFTLNDVRLDGGSPLEGYSLEGNKLRVRLQLPLQPGERITVYFAYQINLPQILPPAETTRPAPFGYTHRQVNLVDWYPYLPPYRQGIGWQAHDPWYFGEHQVYDLADFTVEIRLVNPVEGLVIAASALSEAQGDGLSYKLVGGRSFAWSASPQYQVFETVVDKVIVTSYTFPFGVEGGKAALQHASEALQLYNELLGAYPYASLSLVEADFLDGMEYSGLFFLSRGFYDIYDGTPKGYLTAITVHETAHQWWYGQVGNDQALEPWLDEALCTYMERIFYERTYPQSDPASGMTLDDWWWAFRVNFYEPSGVIDGSIYDYDGFRPYRDAVYLRGAQFLEALRERIGDEAFFTFLRGYAEEKAGQVATADDFFIILEQYSPADITDLRQAYFSP